MNPFFIIFILFLLFIKIDKTIEDVDECLYAIPRKKECFKIPMNDINESCCFLEMDLNKITTTACVRVANDNTEIEKKIFQIKEKESTYSLTNIVITCFSFHLFFPLYLIIILLLY